jgi:hypothetical protein
MEVYGADLYLNAFLGLTFSNKRKRLGPTSLHLSIISIYMLIQDAFDASSAHQQFVALFSP